MWIKCGDITAGVARGFGLTYHKMDSTLKYIGYREAVNVDKVWRYYSRCGTWVWFGISQNKSRHY